MKLHLPECQNNSDGEDCSRPVAPLLQSTQASTFVNHSKAGLARPVGGELAPVNGCSPQTGFYSLAFPTRSALVGPSAQRKGQVSTCTEAATRLTVRATCSPSRLADMESSIPSNANFWWRTTLYGEPTAWEFPYQAMVLLADQDTESFFWGDAWDVECCLGVEFGS